MSSLQKLIPRSEVPPGRFTFVCPETAFRLTEFSLSELLLKVKKHYEMNCIPLIDGWESLVEDRICSGLPPGWCSYGDGTPGEGVHCGVTGEMLIHGAESLSKLVREIFKGETIFVEQDEAEKRADICARCSLNVDASTCLGCGAMAGVIDTLSRIKGGRTTKSDNNLKNCCRCGCRNETIVHIRKDILLQGETSESLAKYPEWCWKHDQSLEIAKDKLSL